MSYAQLLWSALILSCTYILLGVGMNVQYATLRVVNFAQGQLYMVGAMILAMYAKDVSSWGAVIIGLAVCGALSVVIEKLAISPALAGGFQHSRIQVSLLASTAAGIAITGVAANLWGTEEFSVPSLVGEKAFHAGIVITAVQLELLVGTVVSLLLLWYLLYRTSFGMMIRALRSDPYAATLYGVRRSYVAGVAFFVSGAIGGLTGMLVAPQISISANTGIDYSIITILIVIIGGLGRIWRVIPVALTFALAWTLFGTYVSSQYGYYYALFALLGFLALVFPLLKRWPRLGYRRESERRGAPLAAAAAALGSPEKKTASR